MAQSVHTCAAASFETGFFRVATSMALKDDLLAGDSYYMVEIKAMKRLLELGKQSETPALVFADEVLRGTNTVERIAASTQILRSLNHANSLCLAATHDIELTTLLASEYENYHFEESFIDNDIHFPYKILPGAATTRNAIKLLRVMGYDEALVKEAEKMAEGGI
jgi:DNA mismatch repair ATPase MutS